jgi:tRNA(Leu) C34 or U34 (ribose-2'-O)-methylase TrmL
MARIASRGFSCIGLHRPKDALNIGGALRAAGCYGADMLALSGFRYRYSKTDTQKAHRHLPVLHVDDLRKVLPMECTPVAVDLVKGARPLAGYVHPERAMYIFGAEDETLGDEVLGWCRDVIYVPTHQCMNLAATVNVVLYDRQCKMGGAHGLLLEEGAKR